MQKNSYIILVVLLTVIFSASATISAQPPFPHWDYHFPFDFEPKVAGSFGEIRNNHFHSGIDLSTNGKTGLPVYASDTGFVSRIAVSPYGFGKAIYIEHPSGYTSVYAHLDGFSSEVDSLVTMLQYKNESFNLQQYFNKDEIPVMRGDIIGFSGNSGSSSGPHLHFEIRETSGQRPIDPLSFATPVKDDVRPHISGIKVYPLSENATINGEPEAVYFPAVFYDGAFHLKNNPRILANGKIGVGIEVIDYFSDSWRKCGVHSIDLKINGKLEYNYTMDGFFFRDSRYLNSHIDYAEKILNDRIVQKSFVDPYNRIDLYQVNSNRGEVDIKPGASSRFAYSVNDISGNESKLAFDIIGEKNPERDLNKFHAQSEFIDASQPYQYEQKGHAVSFSAESFYRDVYGNFAIGNSDVSLSGTVFAILDKTIPVHNWFEVKIPIPNGINHDGLCGVKFTEDGDKQYADGNVEGTHFVIKTRECGQYGLIKDTIGPDIEIINPPQQLNYRNRSAIELEIEDDFSGIDRYEGEINDRWALFEYDAKNKLLICFFDKIPGLEKGVHLLKMEVSDNAGNINVLETEFTY